MAHTLSDDSPLDDVTDRARIQYLVDWMYDEGIISEAFTFPDGDIVYPTHNKSRGRWNDSA